MRSSLRSRESVACVMRNPRRARIRASDSWLSITSSRTTARISRWRRILSAAASGMASGGPALERREPVVEALDRQRNLGIRYDKGGRQPEHVLAGGRREQAALVQAR